MGRRTASSNTVRGIPRRNVANLDADTRSILSLYRMLITLQEPAGAGEGHLRASLRARRPAAVSPQSGRQVSHSRPKSRSRTGFIASATVGFGRKVLLSTFLDRDGEHIDGVLDLRGNEGVIIGDDHQAG
jgi:alpha-glucosidase